MMITEFQSIIEHGARMRHIYALSCNPVNFITLGIIPSSRQAQAYDADPLLPLAAGPFDNYLTRDGLLYKDVQACQLLVFPKRMQTEIIRRAHDVSHFGVKKTQEVVPRLRTQNRAVHYQLCSLYNSEQESGKSGRRATPPHKRRHFLASWPIRTVGNHRKTIPPYPGGSRCLYEVCVALPCQKHDVQGMNAPTPPSERGIWKPCLHHHWPRHCVHVARICGLLSETKAAQVHDNSCAYQALTQWCYDVVQTCTKSAVSAKMSCQKTLLHVV